MIYSLDGVTPRLGLGVYVAPSAAVIGDVELGEGVSLWFGVVVRGDVERIVIGPQTNVQDNAVLHSDRGSPLVIGAGVTIGHGAIVHGCQIGDGALIGMGAMVLNGARVGKNCLVGAHALITEGKEFPAGTLIVGSPARALRPLTKAEQSQLVASARHYAERGELYSRALRALP